MFKYVLGSSRLGQVSGRGVSICVNFKNSETIMAVLMADGLYKRLKPASARNIVKLHQAFKALSKRMDFAVSPYCAKPPIQLVSLFLPHLSSNPEMLTCVTFVMALCNKVSCPSLMMGRDCVLPVTSPQRGVTSDP